MRYKINLVAGAAIRTIAINEEIYKMKTLNYLFIAQDLKVVNRVMIDWSVERGTNC